MAIDFQRSGFSFFCSLLLVVFYLLKPVIELGVGALAHLANGSKEVDTDIGQLTEIASAVARMSRLLLRANTGTRAVRALGADASPSRVSSGADSSVARSRGAGTQRWTAFSTARRRHTTRGRLWVARIAIHTRSSAA